MEGYVFRLLLMYDKDPTRAMTSKDDEQLGTVSSTQDLLLQSSHSSLIQGLYGTYPAFGPTVRLAKRWIWSHFFSGVLTEEVIELLVTYVCVHPFPHLPPSSRVTGFLRWVGLCLTIHFFSMLRG
jgi:U3 small nucleolar RNA-associated protein 22